MTVPRQVLEGTTYLVTRRCSQRQFLLRPSATVNAVFQFVLAVAAKRCGILLHAYCVLSNHFHLVVTDPEARLPEFSQYLDSLVARALNASLGRSDGFWEIGSYSAVVLASPADVVDRAAYVLANPVAAGLVRQGRDWPGLWSSPASIGGPPVRVSRPEAFFRRRGKTPDTVDLELVAPPGFSSADEFRAALCEALEEREQRARRDVETSGRGFLGARKVLTQRPTSRPATQEQLGGLNPRVASRSKWRRIEVLSRIAQFVAEYRQAWLARRRGDASAVFPAGTYLLRVAHGVPCAAAP